MQIAERRRHRETGGILAKYATLLLVFLVVGTIHAHGVTLQTDYNKFVESTRLSVYSDGSSEVNQTILPVNTTLVRLQLLSPQVGNIIAIDQNKSPVSYELNGGNITLYNLGAARVFLVYDTSALTNKQGNVWSVKFSSPFNISLTLPYQSTILSLSRPPISVSSQNNNTPKLELAPGAWEVGYGLPLKVSQGTGLTTSSSSIGTSSGGNSGTSSSSTPQQTVNSLLRTLSFPVVLGIALAVAAAGTGWLFLSRRNAARADEDGQGLRYDDEAVLRFIKEKGGKVIESEIREHFSMARTSAWRQAKRLERRGYLKITKVGSQNQIELLRDDFPPS